MVKGVCWVRWWVNWAGTDVCWTGVALADRDLTIRNQPEAPSPFGVRSGGRVGIPRLPDLQ